MWLFCFACRFILGALPTRQEKAAKGNLTACLKTQENLTGCLLSHSTCCCIQSWVYAMNLEPVPAIPLCWDCHARACCWPILKTVKSCTSTHTPTTIHHLRYQHPLRPMMHGYTRLCVHMCTLTQRHITAFLNTGLLQGEAIKVSPVSALHWAGEERWFPQGYH